MISCEAPSFDAQLVRLIHGDNNPAGPGPDLATGAGLINVSAAVDYVRNKF